MSHKLTRCVLALLVAVVLSLAGNDAIGQSAVSGSVSGTVTDSSGAVISGATVTITNTDRGEKVRVLKTLSW